MTTQGGTSQLAVSISILTRNRREDVERNLAGIAEVMPLGTEIIVVDNGSTDGTAEMIRDRFPGVHVIQNEANLGVAARNSGVSQAQGDIVVTLDDDVIGISARDLELVRQRFDQVPTLGALNFKVTHHLTGEVCNWCHHRRPEEDADNCFATYEISEGAVAFRRQVYLDAGGYPSSFFISHEGLDLAFRILNNGYDLLYDGRVVVRHTLAEAGRPKWRRYYYDTRNHLWVAVRNMPWAFAIRYVFLHVGAMGIYALRDGCLHHWVSAVWDGLRGLRGQLRHRQVWSSRTALIREEVDRQRPGNWYLVRRRLFRRGGVRI